MSRHKVVLYWLFLLLVCHRAQAEFGQVRSSNPPLLAEDPSLTEDSNIQIHHNRLKRNVIQQREYELDIEVNITENLSDDGLKLLLKSAVYPISVPFENGTLNITNVNITTVCRNVNNETQCTCEGGFIWNSTFCSKYQSCNGSITEGQTCDCIRSEPTEGMFCMPESIMTTPTTSTMSTTTLRTTTPTTTSMTPTTTPTTPTTPTTMTPKITLPPDLERQRYAFRVVGLPFTKELSNSSSLMFKNRSDQFKTLLEVSFQSVRPDAIVNILGFTNGSVIILFEVITNASLTSEEFAASSEQLQNRLPADYKIESLPSDEIPCTDQTFGTTNFNIIAEIPCEDMPGVKKRRCGRNGVYEEVLDFCISEEINNILEAVNTTDLENNFSSLLEQLSSVTDEVTVNTPGNVQAVVEIMRQISNVNSTVNETDMRVRTIIYQKQSQAYISELYLFNVKEKVNKVKVNFLQTVSRMISSSSKDTWEILSDSSENIRNPSFRLLKSVENFNTRFNMQNNSLDIKEENLMFKARRNVHQDNKTSINLNFDNISTAEYDNLSATLFISPEKPNEAPNVTVISIAYPTWIDILPNTTTFDGNFLINSLVLTVVINIKEPINVKMTFSLRNRTLDFNTAVCGFWDFTGRGAWNDTGCKSEINEENITCHCDHFTSFSILMSPDTKDSPALNYITSIGVAISIGSLLITIIIEAIVWKHVTKNKTSYIRHVGILNIAVNLLVADVWFIVASAVEPGTRACTAATFFTHFFYLALFFWMLTLGLLLVYRLLFPFHDLSRSVMMGISFAVGYLPPLIISIITIGVTFPRKSYTREGACWLGWETEYPLLAFVIPALVIIAINVIILFIVIFKLLRPTIGDGSRANNQERDAFKQIVRSIAVLTPILGLTWAFGIPTFQKDSPVAFHYIFTILNAFQGFFILVFGTFMDNKVREALLKKFSLRGFSSRSKTSQNVSTAKSSSKPHPRFHAKRQSYNLTEQLHSSDNNPSLSYSSLN
ncbi:adhesion G protein-coupled receptor F5-like [Chiloscyllium plagiosum]|uniref:adhesion G protein-coupled receptor F5-like n=1 Tax=Chiloscyllium plagiosum TaxID=36176 RepID=UPI001CB831E3|nr:adhesion G protein-coupled receptor F5-like [Chiloscyllium plagiosum]